MSVFTSQELEKIQQDQMQVHLQGLAKRDGMQANVVAARQAATLMLRSPFGTVQAEPVSPALGGPGGLGAAPVETLASENEFVRSPEKADSEPSLLLPVLVLFVVGMLLYALLRRMWT